MLATGVIDDSKVLDEIIGSDSKAGIIILKRSGSSKSTEAMLSDSLAKVMTMPKHNVRRCEVKDLQLGTIAVVMPSQMVKVGASAAQDQTIDRRPGSEWFV